MAKLDKDLEVLELFGAKITLEDIKALVTPELNTNVFKMTDALFEKNAGDLLYYFRLFRQQNMEVPAIIGLLSSQIRFTYQVKVLAENRVPKSEMESMLNASSGRIWHTQQKAARFRTDGLLGHLSRLHQLDLAYKSGQIDQDLGFEKFVIDMLIQNNPL
jgi:DNA polymerase-3 subunit delta